MILRCRFKIDDHEGLRFHRIEKNTRRLAAGDGEWVDAAGTNGKSANDFTVRKQE